MDCRPPRLLMIAAAPLLGVVLVSCQPAVLPEVAPTGPDQDRVPAEQVDEQPGPIVFTGSSSIRLWEELPKDYPGMGVVNLGFGGSQLCDLIDQFERVILEPRPRQVVIYSGSNDIDANKPASVVVDDLKAVVQRIHRELPDTRVTFLSIGLNPARWEQRGTVRVANAAIAAFMAADHRRQFIDVTSAMLGSDGLPKPEIFTDDGLHMNRKGYELWIPLIRPALVSAEG